MWNLRSPDTAATRDHLDTVFPSCANPVVVTEQEKDAIEALYEAYFAALGRPSTALLGNELTLELRQAMHDAYGEVQQNGKLSALRDMLKLLATECPYCGFGQIPDLDHHLPRAVFKPFSIFPLNLVPCCATCNRGKTRKPKQHQGETHLLNAYLEDVSAYDFLKTDVYLDPEKGSLQVEYNIVRPADMGAELYARLHNHFKVFDLQQRYAAQINIYLGGLEVALEQAFDASGADGLRSFLMRSASKMSARFGRNDWRTALLRGLAACDDFVRGDLLGHSATVMKRNRHLFPDDGSGRTTSVQPSFMALIDREQKLLLLTRIGHMGSR